MYESKSHRPRSNQVETNPRVVTPRPAVYTDPPRPKESIVDYSEHSTTHGIFYVCERGATHFSHIFWLLVCLFLGGFCIYLIVQAYDNWKNNPVATSVQTTSLPIEDIDFPVITICGLGSIKSLRKRAFMEQAINFVLETSGTFNASSTVSNATTAFDVLEDNNLIEEFFEAKYPGLSEIDPTYLAEFMSLENPDEALKATAVLSAGSFNPCSEQTSQGARKKRSTGDQCPYGYIWDSDASRCYDNEADGLTSDEQSARDYCIFELEVNSFFFSSQADLTGLKNVVSSGSLTSVASGNKFWVSLFRNDYSDEYLAPDGSLLTNSSFDFLKIGDISDTSKRCLTLSYKPANGQFVAEQADCVENLAMPLCFTWAYVAPNCSDPSTVTESNEDSQNSLLDFLLDPAKRPTMGQNVANRKKFIKQEFKSLDVQKAYESLFELLWYSQLPCFDVERFSNRPNEYSLLKKCIWKGVTVACSKIFKTFPTDRGMCCSFNSEEVENEFQKGIYASTIKELQDKDSRFAMETSELPLSWSKNKEPTSKSAINKGLTVILDAHSDKIQASSVDQDFGGFFATVTSKGEHPLVNAKSIYIRPGHENLVAMTPTKIVATESLPNLDPDERQCFFRHGDAEAMKTVSLFSKYTHSSCMLECQIDWGKEQMKLSKRTPCIPWYLPNTNDNNETLMCDPWNAVAFRKSWNTLDQDYCSKCKPDCETTFYQTSVSAVKFRKCDNRNMGISRLCNLDKFFLYNELPNPPIFGQEVLTEYGEGGFDAPGKVLDSLVTNIRSTYKDPSKEIFSKFALKSENAQYNAYKEDIAVATFYFDSSTAFQYTRAPRMTWTDFMAQVGGLMGLCLGFSFASMIEIVYWLGFRLWCNPIFRRRS